jgi:hypothetical protein
VQQSQRKEVVELKLLVEEALVKEVGKRVLVEEILVREVVVKFELLVADIVVKKVVVKELVVKEVLACEVSSRDLVCTLTGVWGELIDSLIDSDGVVKPASARPLGFFEQLKPPGTDPRKPSTLCMQPLRKGIVT